MRLCAFPLGRTFYGPSDRLGHRVAEILLEPTETRDQLTSGMFVPTDPADPLAQLEEALVQVIAAEPVEQKLREAVKAGSVRGRTDGEIVTAGVEGGIITADEAELLRQAHQARREVTRVDDFPHL